MGPNLPSASRARLLINDEPVVEVDYPRAAPSNAPCATRRGHASRPVFRAGIRLENLAKRALLVALNAKSRPEAITALMGSRLGDGARWPYGWAETDRLLQAVIERNPAIREDIAADAGIDLMHDDAEIALRVVKSCLRDAVPCLPIRDSFVVPARHELETASGDGRRVGAVCRECSSGDLTGLKLLQTRKKCPFRYHISGEGGRGDARGEGRPRSNPVGQG